MGVVNLPSKNDLTTVAENLNPEYLRRMKFLAVLAAVVVAGSAFFPWITVESKQLVLTGVDALNFGKPAYLNFFFTGLFLLFLFLPLRWGQAVAVLAAAMNLAWAFRNFLLMSACPMGECPARETALYVLLVASVLMLIAVLFLKRKPNSAV